MRAPVVSFTTLAIPFRHVFAHASAVRVRAANVLVRLQDSSGIVGLGEGCPRPYVTGETVESALEFLATRASSIVEEVTDLASLRDWLRQNSAEIDRHPSAVCALEMALLDIFARRSHVSVEDLLGLKRRHEPLRATAVYGSSSFLVFSLQRLRFLSAGMTDSKLKLTGDPSRDSRRAGWLARRGPVRLDANGLWSDAQEAIAALRRIAPFAWAVEEPLKSRDWSGMVAVAQASGLALVLDESFTTVTDLTTAPEGTRWIANVRVSKLGGILRTLDTIEVARQRGFGMIVGAQVGESGLLARAGLLAAASAGAALKGFEAAYGTHLLAYDIVRPSVTFDAKGEINADRFSSTGWGLDAEPRLLRAFK